MEILPRIPRLIAVSSLAFLLALAPAAVADYAKSNPLLHERIGDQVFVVLADKSGAMRVYETNGVTFSAWDGDQNLRDRDGLAWALHEDKLVSEGGDTLPRMPSHSAFWFGWYGPTPKPG